MKNILLGKDITLQMPNGEKRKAQFAIVELGEIIASHNEYTFSSSHQYPTSPDGHNINDRNYEGDKQAQAQVAEYAQNLQPERLIVTSRTPSGTPIINIDGIVVSGNNRVMSLKRAAKEYPQNYSAYKDFFKEELEAFGFKKYADNKPNHFLNGGGKLGKFEHPVLVRVDYDIPTLNTAELAKYNMDTKKGKRPIDKAIELSSVLRTNPGCRDGIAQVLSAYERMSDFYANMSDQKKVIDLMTKCNLITEQEKPEYWTPDNGITQGGKQFLESVLASVVLKKEALIVSENDGVRDFRRVIITSLPTLMNNQTLTEGVLIDDLNLAILLQSDMQHSGLPFSSQLSQISAFGDARIYSIKSLYLNRLLDKGQRRFKAAIARYNQSVQSNSGSSFFEAEKLSLFDIFEKTIQVEAMRDSKDAPIEQKRIESYIKIHHLLKELTNVKPTETPNNTEAEIKIIQTRLKKKGINKTEKDLLLKKLKKLQDEYVAHINPETPKRDPSVFYKKAVLGNIMPITLINGEVHRIQYAIVEMRNVVASHNELDFSQNMNYPANPDGSTTNDRDYATDIDSQNQIINGAKSIDVEKFFTITATPSGTPILNRDGIAYSGNKRSQIIKRAASLHLDQYQNYRNYLCDNHSKFGFTICENNASTFKGIQSSEKIDFQQPMLIRIDLDAAPYTNAESAKYNKKAEVFPLLDKEGKRRIDNDALDALEAYLETLPQTKDLHTINGEYTDERKAFHEKLIKEMESGNTCIKQGKPIAIFTGGAPGSGKSTFIKKNYDWLDNPSIFHIDSDEVRAKLPEYQGWNASRTHEETTDIVNELIDYIAPKECQFDVIIDGTFTNLRKYKSMIKKVQDLGYQTFAIFMQIDPEISMQRAIERYQRSGRYVPRAVIEDVNNKGDKVFLELKNEIDGWIEVDGLSSKILAKGGNDLPRNRDYSTLGKVQKSSIDFESQFLELMEYLRKDKSYQIYYGSNSERYHSNWTLGILMGDKKVEKKVTRLFGKEMDKKFILERANFAYWRWKEHSINKSFPYSFSQKLWYEMKGVSFEPTNTPSVPISTQEMSELIESLNLSVKFLRGKAKTESLTVIKGLELSLKYA